jgi:tetratricopeptide (TPR) repeat protein
VLVLALLGAALVYFVPKGKIFPTKLIALGFMQDGREMLLTPDSQVVVNPRDTLQLTTIKTNGWLSWGTRVVSPQVDLRPVTTNPGVVIRDLFPGVSFEKPASLQFDVLAWNRQIGKVTFLVQLDYKDWLNKANATPDLDLRIEYLQKALADNSTNILIKTQLAGLYFDIKNYKEAEKLYREINQSGESKDICEKLLLIYQVTNKTGPALHVYLDLLKMNGDSQTFADFLAYLKKKRSVSQAQSFLERHQRDIPAAYRSQAMVEIAELAGAHKDWQTAAKAWRSAQKAGVHNSDVQYNLAVTLMRTGKTDEAITAFEQYLQKNPNDVKTLGLVAGLCLKAGKFAKAKAVYESMAQKNPHDPQPLVSLVALAQKTNDQPGEIDGYQKLLKIDPNNRKYLFNLAMLYVQMKKYDKAVGPLKTLASSAPQDVQLQKQLLAVYQKLNDPKGQAQVRLQIAKLSPNDSGNLDILYRSFAQKKDYKGMQAFFKPIAVKNPNAVNVHKYLLEAATKLGDNKAALHELEQLIRLQPKQVEYHRLAAYLYEKQGNYQASAAQLKAVLNMDFKDQKAQQDYERVKLEELQNGSLKDGPKPAKKTDSSDKTQKAKAAPAHHGPKTAAGAKKTAKKTSKTQKESRPKEGADN